MDVRGKLCVRCASPHAAVQVVLNLRKKACPDLSVGGKAHATARTTERLSDGCDDANLATVVFEGVSASCFACIALGQGFQRHQAVDTLNDLGEGNDDFRRPETVFLERHELDEADNHVFLAGKAGEALDFVVIESAQKN